MLAAQLRGRPRLAHEALHDLRTVHQVGQQELERDRLLQMQVGGTDDDTHASLTDDPVDAELTREYSSHRNHRSRVSHTFRHSPDESTTWSSNRARRAKCRQRLAASRRGHCDSRIFTTGRLTPAWRRTR